MSSALPLKSTPVEWRRREPSPDSLVAAARRGRYVPGPRLDAVEDTVQQLLEQNGAALRDAGLRGCSDAELLERITVWRRPARSAFLGLRVTTECNVGHDTTPSRCVMCDQALFGTDSWERRLADWLQAVDEATEGGRRRGVLVNLSGGEPLLRVEPTLRLIRFAADRGAVVNLNSNGHALTENLALRLIGAGLAKLHVSVHGASAAVHEAIQPARRGFALALRGIAAMARAKERSGSDYPVLHLNCVLTRYNLDDYPELVAWTLARRRLAPRYDQGHTQSNPNRRDLCVHLLALVGERYRALQPDVREMARFEREIFPQAERLWQAWLDRHGVPQAQRCSYAELIVKSYFDASMGEPAPIARRCHVGATQAYVLPDGSAHVCGRHADHPGHPAWPAIGRLGQAPVQVLAQRAAAAAGVPSPACQAACAAHTRHYNHAVERQLLQRLRETLAF